MDSLSLIKSPIIEDLETFKSLFDASLSHSNALLNDVLAHIRSRKGKMMRPMLVFLSAKLFGRAAPATYHAAAALELLHTASLVHDDVVDESGERRGQPSVNAAFNNKVAVLVGDFLLATSLQQVNLTHNHDIVGIVSALGQELADGELLQLSGMSDDALSEQAYFDIIRKKTAVLFAACMQAGALSVGASPQLAEFARLFGEYVGICFQIKDDIFDYYDDNRAIGKPTGNDMLEGKLTLPALYVLNAKSDEKVLDIAFKVKRRLASLHEIAFLIDFSKRQGGIDYALQTIGLYKRKALDLLERVPESPVKSALSAYLDYVVERQI
ncbi:MAG: polyprenyl synthetase family protein [Prevotellaceae bacterium]|nr:polyprenyl synthetase family protein [Prevotellaceae bacterium]